MGAIGGLIRFDGLAVDEAWLAGLGSRLARLGPDGGLSTTSGCVGFVHRRYDLSNDDDGRAGICSTRQGTLLLFDGRLDNGPELAAVLGWRGEDARRDLSVLLAGFDRFGSSFAAKLVGDFALAYWNPAARELSLCRDSVGVRTLYYHHGPQWLVFSSDLGALLHTAKIPTNVDDDYVAGFLIAAVDEGLTPYRDVKPVRPGHLLTVSQQGKIANHEVWSLSPAPDAITYSNDSEYEAHFAQLFSDALRARLRTSRPVAAELSGGLDSSSIVCMAKHVLRSSQAQSPVIITFSHTGHSSTAKDSDYITAVERWCDLKGSHIAEDLVPILTPARSPQDLHVLSLLAVSAGFETVVCDEMRSAGARVLLSGQGGDEMFYSTNNPLPYFGDLWLRGHFGELNSQLNTWSAPLKQPYSTLLWKSFKLSWVRRMLRWGALNTRKAMFTTWLHNNVRERALAANRTHERRLRAYRMPTQRDHVSSFLSVMRLIASGHFQEFDARYITFPCLHRPLVEFLHAVPFTQKLRYRESRSLQRRALREILPPEVVARRGKTLTIEPILRSLRNEAAAWQALLTDSEVEARGYIDIAEARASLSRAIAGVGHENTLLNRALALEIWLRTLSRRPLPSAYGTARSGGDALLERRMSPIPGASAGEVTMLH
jgi:asparagine synthase (glutamine-hydrolysing)